MKRTARSGGAGLFRRISRLALQAGVAFSALSVIAYAQLVPHIINQNELGETVAQPVVTHQPLAQASQPSSSVGAIKPFRLLTVQAQGGEALPQSALAATWQPYLGTIVASRQLSAILIAIGRLCEQQNFALYAVSLPPQNFAAGNLRIRISIGHVGAVSIQGNTKGSDLWLLKHYAARIIVDNPLHRPTLERNILLMETIPGLTVGSALHPIPGAPGAEQLQLGIVRKPVEAGFDINNQGDRQLDIVQTTINLTINGLFREGERDQLVFGAPLTLRRYQYYGLVHQEPIGSNGDTLTVTAGDLVTNPTGEINSGTAQIVSAVFSDPLIETVTRNLTASIEGDYLNSNEALLSQTISTERTRSLRAGISFARAGDLAGIDSGSLTIAQGLDILGAGRGSIAYGGPSFTKFSASFSRLQALPRKFVFTFSAIGQYAPDHLPASEQFLYGGPEFGQAYDAATMAGDSGVSVSGELAHPIPLFQKLPPAALSGLTGFGFADWGRIWNTHTQFMVPRDTGASAGAGIRFTILKKITMSFGAASQLDKPLEEDKLQQWRFIYTISGRF
jgi:hemolysin activation/secretion protein